MKYIRRVLAALRQADERFALIDPGDKILIGVSGGKDSLCLLKALSIYGLFAKKDFAFQPVLLNLGFPGFNPEPLKEYCESLGHPLLIEDSSFVYDVLKAHAKEGKHLPCSICSRMKKAAMNAVAHRLGFNKVAFAHHKDDAIETLFMNMIHGGRVATFEPKMYLEKSQITFIRPLVLATESDLAHMAIEEGLPVLASPCPAAGFTEREATKELLQSLYQKYPESEENFKAMLSNYEGFQLFFDQIEIENPTDPRYSLRPLLSALDALDYEALRKKDKNLDPLKKGATTYLVHYRHRVVGEISFRWDNPHQVSLMSLNLSQAHAAKKGLIVRQVIAQESAKANPVIFLYLAKDKKLARELGFALKKDLSDPKRSYSLKIKR